MSAIEFDPPIGYPSIEKFDDWAEWESRNQFRSGRSYAAMRDGRSVRKSINAQLNDICQKFRNLGYEMA